MDNKSIGAREPQTRQMGGDLREAHMLASRGQTPRLMEAIECFQDGADRFDGIGGGIHSDDGVLSTPLTSGRPNGRQQNAADIVGRGGWLQTNAGRSARRLCSGQR